MRATFPADLITLDFVTQTIWWGAKIIKLGFSCDFLQAPLLKDPQSMFPFNARGQISHKYKLTGAVIGLCILIFTFLKTRQNDKNSQQNVIKFPRN
jgi:hypothetical protein